MTWLNDAPPENRSKSRPSHLRPPHRIGRWVVAGFSHPSAPREFEAPFNFIIPTAASPRSQVWHTLAPPFLVDVGLAGDTVRIRTGAGVKCLKMLKRSGCHSSLK